MTRFPYNKIERVGISAGAAYGELLERDREIIEQYLEVIAEAETSERQVLDRLTLTTRDRHVVPFDFKAEFPGVLHNEFIELKNAAIRVAQRRYRGAEFELTRVVNRRRFELEGRRLKIRIGGGSVEVEVDEVPSGELISVRLFEDHVDFHLRRQPLLDRIAAIDIGNRHTVVFLEGDEMEEWVIGGIPEIIEAVRCHEGISVFIGRLMVSRKVDKKMGSKQMQLYYALLRDRVQGVYVVSERYTSQRCHVCGKEGVRGGKVFFCEMHGRMHADVNAAINIGKKAREVYG